MLRIYGVCVRSRLGEENEAGWWQGWEEGTPVGVTETGALLARSAQILIGEILRAPSLESSLPSLPYTNSDTEKGKGMCE